MSLNESNTRDLINKEKNTFSHCCECSKPKRSTLWSLKKSMQRLPSEASSEPRDSVEAVCFAMIEWLVGTDKSAISRFKSHSDMETTVRCGDSTSQICNYTWSGQHYWRYASAHIHVYLPPWRARSRHYNIYENGNIYTRCAGRRRGKLDGIPHGDAKMGRSMSNTLARQEDI